MTPPLVTMADPANEVPIEPTIDASKRLIVALDMKDKNDVIPLVDELGNDVSFYKVGMVRLLDYGIELVQELTKNRGKEVFLDLKSFDIAETVRETVARARDMGAVFVTVHGSGAAIEAAKKAAGADLKVLAVTFLTSLSRKDIFEIYGMPIENETLGDMAVKMAKRFLEKGCDGVIASPEEAKRLRTALQPRLLIVTPGIRMDGTSHDDHKRFGPPRQAIKDGANYLVLGRPIYDHPDHPNALMAAQDYIEEIRKGLDDVASADEEDSNVKAFEVVPEATKDDD